jgi:hypothetical protein
VDSLSQAQEQLTQIESLCRLPMPPVTMPPDALGAAGIERIWLGLGFVGIWAAIDAFRERRQPNSQSSAIETELGGQPHLERCWKEIEDLRHLYAHHFGAVAEGLYLQDLLVTRMSRVFRSAANRASVGLERTFR